MYEPSPAESKIKIHVFTYDTKEVVQKTTIAKNRKK